MDKTDADTTIGVTRSFHILASKRLMPMSPFAILSKNMVTSATPWPSRY